MCSNSWGRTSLLSLKSAFNLSLAFPSSSTYSFSTKNLCSSSDFSCPKYLSSPFSTFSTILAKIQLSILPKLIFSSSFISFCRESTNCSYDSFAITVRVFISNPLTLSPFWLTAILSPLPISCLFFISEVVSFRVHIWKTFGLSHPSFKAEWEKINESGSSKLSSFSLSLIILLNVSLSALVFPFVSFSSKYSFPLLDFFLSAEKYPSCAKDALW